MRAISKKNSKAFVEAVSKGLLEIGATKVEDRHERLRAFELDTIVGKLTINIDTDSFGYTVFSRFEDVARAKHKFNCNPHSGKYNVHIGSDGITPQKAAEIALITFESTVPEESSTTSSN